MGYFDDQLRINAASRGARAVRGEMRDAGAGPNLPVFEGDPDGAEEGGQWVRSLDDAGEAAPAISVVIGGETYRAHLVREGDLLPVEDAAPVGCGKEWFGADDPPGGRWMIRNGRLLEQATFPELFAVIGGTYNTGGEGPTQFRIPDSRGRVGVGAGQGPGLTNRPLGARLGAETVALAVAHMPAHDHGGATGSGGFHAHGGTTGAGGSHAHGGSTGDGGSHAHGGSTGDAGGHDHGYIAHSGTGDLQPGSAPTFHQGNETRRTGNVVGHNHGIGAVADHSHNIGSQAAHDHSVASQAAHDHPVASQGGGGAHENVQPSLSQNFIIRVRP